MTSIFNWSNMTVFTSGVGTAYWSNMTVFTSEVRTAYHWEHPSSPIFSVEFLFRLLQWCSISSNFSFLLSNIVRLCVLFLLVIVSSILLWLTTSDYLLGTFRLFLYLHSRVKSFPHHDISLYISYKTIYYQNILLKSFLIWFSWNFQHSYSYKIVTSRIYICA
jgi:hypothetical protein